MDRTGGREIRRIACAALALWGFGPGAAAAEDPVLLLDLSSKAARDRIPFVLGDVTKPSRWLSVQHFHIAKKSGIGYTRRLKFGEHSFTVGVRGPVLRKQKALGLAFRIRF